MINSTEKEATEKQIEELKKGIKPPSIAVIGRTGVGKSSLVNAIFGIDTATVGVGYPVTAEYKRYPNTRTDDTPIFLYDSPGFETERSPEYLQNTIQFLNDRSVYNRNISEDEQIHLVWYLINTSSARLEHFDIEVLETVINLQMPLVVVLTQCDRAWEEEKIGLKQLIGNELQKKNHSCPVLEVSARNPEGKPFGLWDLVQTSIDLIPNAYSRAILMAQRVNIKVKRPLAWTFIAASATTCIGSAFIPAPGSTPTALISSQVVLLTALVNLYNAGKFFNPLLGVSTITLQGLSAFVGTALLDIVSQSALVIPIFGWAGYTAGALASGTAAATYMVLVGLTTVRLLEILHERNFIARSGSDPIVKDFIRQSFDRVFKNIESQVKVTSKGDLDKLENKIESILDKT